MQRPVHRRASRYLLYKVVSLSEFFTTDLDDLIGMGGMGQVVDRKDQGFWEASRIFFMFISIFSDLLDYLSVAVRRGNLDLDFFGRKFPFVFELIIGFDACSCIDHTDVLPFFEKGAFHADIGFDLHRLIVHEPAVKDGLFCRVPVDHFFEERQCVKRRRRREADFNGVEMVEYLSPDGRVFCCVAPMAFIGYDYVEGMDGNIYFSCIIFIIRITLVLRKSVFWAEEVDGHPLNRGDIHEGVTILRRR